MAYIYTLEDPISGQIRYIGTTIRSLKQRWYDHCSSYTLKKENNKRATWIKSLKNKNLKPVIKILEEVDNDIRYDIEELYIVLFKSWGFNLVNSNNGGKGGVNYTNPRPFKHSEETKKKISLANQRPHSEEWIKNAAKSAYKPIIQTDLNGMFIAEYDSTTNAAIKLGDINFKKNISSVLRGLRKSAYGFKWKFKV